jgi:hypothetical protein
LKEIRKRHELQPLGKEGDMPTTGADLKSMGLMASDVKQSECGRAKAATSSSTAAFVITPLTCGLQFGEVRVQY